MEFETFSLIEKREEVKKKKRTVLHKPLLSQERMTIIPFPVLLKCINVKSDSYFCKQ